MKILSIFPFYFLMLVATVAGCDKKSQEAGQKHLEDAAASLQQTVIDKGQRSAEELKKVHQREYHIETFRLDEDSADVESKLNVLGAERWDCFDTLILKSKNELRIFCKRQVDTPLRWVPRTILAQ